MHTTTHYVGLLPDIQQSESTEQGIRTLALAMVEGTHIDALGQEFTYDEDRLNAIALASNDFLNRGREIPFFHAPHDFGFDGYDNRNKVGLVKGPFIVQRITTELLPKAEMTEIVGKLGLFTYVDILRDDAIALYKRGLIKPISVGISISDHEEMPMNSVYEVSAVAWGAIPQAMLFGRFPINRKGKKFALTLEGAIAEEKAFMDDTSEELIKASDLTWAFMDVLRSIWAAPDGELLGRDRGELTRSAIADLNARLQEALGVARSSPPSVPVFSREVPEMPTDPSATPTPEIFEPSADAGVDAIADLTERIAALEKKEQQQASTIEQQAATINALQASNQQMTANAAIASQWSTLKDRAMKLNRAGRLPKAALLSFFPDGETQQQAVAKFARSPEEGGEAPQDLDKIAAQLNFVEQFGQPVVQFGAIATGADPVGANPNQATDTDEEAKEYAKSYNTRNPVKKAY